MAASEGRTVMARLDDKDDYGYHEAEVIQCLAKCITALIALAMVCATVSRTCDHIFPYLPV